jgi:hypothetical protein
MKYTNSGHKSKEIGIAKRSGRWHRGNSENQKCFMQKKELIPDKG